jgi:predicted ATPase
VWWIPLESAQTEDDMIGRIAEGLKVHLQPQPTVREQLWNFHRDRKLLLLLDNVEQIEPEAASRVIYGLLNAGPGIKCLATSRRSLNLASEHLIELAPLPQTQAQALFVGRARARRPSFALSEDNAADIAEICRQLEGVPLALEIAASLVGVLSPRQLLNRLDDRLRLLVARDPSRPRRQQALRAAIDWSHDLLGADGKSLFARLSVFHGGFTLEAAEAVACDDECADLDVLSGLLELRDQSLLRKSTSTGASVDADADADADADERLVMLESVRQYAAEKLEGDEEAAAWARHAGYFLAWAEDKASLLGTKNEIAALAELESEFDNLRAALSWSHENDPETCAALALRFHQPLQARGAWEEASRCLETGWEAAQALGEQGNALRAALRFQKAALAHDLGEKEEARWETHLALKEFRVLEAVDGIAGCLNVLGLLDTEDGKLAEALAHFEAALALWPQSSRAGRAGRGKTLHNMARLAAVSGDEPRAQQLYEESLDWRKRAGDARGEARTLGNLGALARARGDLAQAEALYRQSLGLRRGLREPLGIAIMLNNLGDLAILREDWPRALSFLVHAERMLRELGSPLAEEPAGDLQKCSEKLGESAPILLAQAETSNWESLL